MGILSRKDFVCYATVFLVAISTGLAGLAVKTDAAFGMRWIGEAKQKVSRALESPEQREQRERLRFKQDGANVLITKNSGLERITFLVNEFSKFESHADRKLVYEPLLNDETI